MTLKFKRIGDHDLPLPSYESEGAAGMDIRAAMAAYLSPRMWLAIPTGWSVEIPPGHELQCRPRSGLAFKNGVTVLNTPGTIDGDFRGEIQVILINHSHAAFRIERGDRIAQLVYAPVSKADCTEVEELSSTERGSGGFGSTGLE